tara:strand:- start:1041 stop:1709 length:669 start_codon:yes stop_codon:yes gene_type:complete
MRLVKKSLLTISVFFCFAYAGEKIAIVTKIIGKAEYARGQNSSKSLNKGLIIESGDVISTFKGGFVALIFIDDKSALKIKEKTKITVNGKKSSRKISKKINLSNGTIRAQVEKNKDFIIQTSVSVASVKGTDFWVISDEKIGDSIIGLKGTISLSNRISGDKIDIFAGVTGISSTNGSLQSFKSDPKNTPIDLDQNDKEAKQLEIIFKDSAGKKKKLIIDYK